jgi:exosortase/archaeosortase family protein
MHDIAPAPVSARVRRQARAPRYVPASARLLLAWLTIGAAGAASFATMLASWQFQSSLAELAIVPLISAGLSLVAIRRHPFVATARMGRADWFVAGTCAVLVIGGLLLAWYGTGNFFSVLRFDLLLLPFTAVAAFTLLFGVRSLLAFAPAIAVLALAWPVPYAALLERVSTGLTHATGLAVQRVLDVFPIATPVATEGDLRLTVPAANGAFDVVVSSACSGMGGMAAFSVVAIASFSLLRGSTRARFVWVSVGLAVVFAANVLRIITILLIGRSLGEDAAIGLVHPVAGLLSLNAAFLLMLALAGPMGLTRRPIREAGFGDNPLFSRLPGDGVPDRRQLLARGLALGLGAALVMTVNIATVGRMPGSSAAGAPVTVSAAEQAQQMSGLDSDVAVLGEEEWARAYFGGESRWMRYEFRPGSGAVDSIASAPTVWMDSITTDSLRALQTHSLQSCYQFHDYEVLADEPIAIGGVTGHRYEFRTPQGSAWHVLSWEWPFRNGDLVRHERVVLMTSTQAGQLSVGGRAIGTGVAATGTDPRAALMQRAETLVADSGMTP